VLEDLGLFAYLTAGCIGTDPPVRRRNVGQSNYAHIEDEHVHHAMRVTSTETRCEKGRLAPLNATRRWVVERTNSWQNAHRNLLWCTERRGRVVDFWVALSDVVVIVRRLVREGWVRYRWEGRPSRRP
jgi:hypothetical protein